MPFKVQWLNHHCNSHHKGFSYFPANFLAEKVQINTQGHVSEIGRQFSSHCRLSVQDLKWRLSCQYDLAAFLFARYHPARLFFPIPYSEVRSGWLLVVPGQLQDELVESHPNHRVDEFAAANSTVDDRCQKYIQIGKN